MATASTIIKTASNEIGVKETGNNNVKYNTEYYGKAVVSERKRFSNRGGDRICGIMKQ